MESTQPNNKLFTFLMHEAYTYINSSKTKLDQIANHKAIQNNELLQNEVLEVLSYIEQINLIMNYVDLKQNPESIDSILESHPRDIDLLKSFQKPNQYFKNLLKGKRLHYKVLKTENVPLVKGYPILRSIANIMLDNAIKYSPKDSDIECSFDYLSNEITIVMNNVGPYIEPEELDQIIKLGYRGKNAISSGIRGQGFGLDFLSEIVEKIHFGKLNVNSTYIFQMNDTKYGTFECKITLPVNLL